MLHARTLMLAALPLVLTACTGWRGGSLQSPAPLPSLTQACPTPSVLPDRALSQGEVETLWGRDRSALRNCRDRHAGLSAWIDTVVGAPKTSH